MNRGEVTQGKRKINLGKWLNNRGKKHIQPNIDKKRLTPQIGLDINTANKMTTEGYIN